MGWLHPHPLLAVFHLYHFRNDLRLKAQVQHVRLASTREVGRFLPRPGRLVGLGTFVDLSGGFKYFFIFIPIWGNDPIWRAYFSEGLKPPTSDFFGQKSPQFLKAHYPKVSCPYTTIWQLVLVLRSVSAYRQYVADDQRKSNVDTKHPADMKCITSMCSNIVFFHQSKRSHIILYNILYYPPWNYQFAPENVPPQ